jgi:hypothetical protein
MIHARFAVALLFAAATGSLLVASAALAEDLEPASFGTDARTVDSGSEQTVFRKVMRTVDSDADLVLSRPTFWDRACNGRSLTVTVTEAPANGTVSVTEGLNTANANPKFGTPGPCAGVQIMGKQIVYRSRAGFHGTDVVAYEYISDRGERGGATVVIAVR